ncbi:hypothetical protein KIN20_037549 [Parelaphostrongylus tenuis]|uniref:Uncharacterized protein n=1 Tax=Parelaphostrongylus tenuis TaxID=148309 RepID=A0AAD5REF3_PARTN|nr:hypothetical protein KIN20_037549 [Parelaphostrongylus tenuis]
MSVIMIKENAITATIDSPKELTQLTFIYIPKDGQKRPSYHLIHEQNRRTFVGDECEGKNRMQEARGICKMEQRISQPTVRMKGHSAVEGFRAVLHSILFDSIRPSGLQGGCGRIPTPPIYSNFAMKTCTVRAMKCTNAEASSNAFSFCYHELRGLCADGPIQMNFFKVLFSHSSKIGLYEFN